MAYNLRQECTDEWRTSSSLWSDAMHSGGQKVAGAALAFYIDVAAAYGVLHDRKDQRRECRLQQTSEAERRFNDLVTLWRNETAHISVMHKIAMNPHYQDMIGMGSTALPLILRALPHQPAPWFWALRHIAGENPVRAEEAGNYPLMAKAWTDWGRERGII